MITHSDADEYVSVDTMKNLKKLSGQLEKAERTGSYSVLTVIVLIALCLSVFCYKVTTFIFPENLKIEMKEMAKRYAPKPKAQKGERDFTDDIFDLLDMILNYGVQGGVFGATGFYGYKVYRKHKSKLAMKLALEAEMARFKEAMAKELNETGNSKKFETFSNDELVGLFNLFAQVMEIEAKLPREESETASEYFSKVAHSLRTSKSQAERASDFFNATLYGSKKSTDEDRKAFLQILIAMMEKSGIKDVSALTNRKA